MAVRGIHRGPTVRGAATPTNCPIYLDSDDNTPKLIPAGSGSTEVALALAASASGAKFAAGTATCVSGAVTVATGLSTVLGFAYSLNATGFATGATEVTAIAINPTLPLATGAVACQGYRLFTVTASASGTGTFNWVAVGM